MVIWVTGSMERGSVSEVSSNFFPVGAQRGAVGDARHRKYAGGHAAAAHRAVKLPPVHTRKKRKNKKKRCNWDREREKQYCTIGGGGIVTRL